MPDARERNERAKREAQDEMETTHGGWNPRKDSLYWYPLNMVEEIVVYPLLYGQARLVRGRRDTDSWQVGYDYPDRASALKAAGSWDGKSDPGFGWVRKYDEEEAESA